MESYPQSTFLHSQIQYLQLYVFEEKSEITSMYRREWGLGKQPYIFYFTTLTITRNTKNVPISLNRL